MVTTKANASGKKKSIAGNQQNLSLGIEIELQGRSDNSGRRGVDAIDELRGLLEGIVGVKRVKADLQDLKSGSYPFQMTVSPDDSMPEAGSRKRNRNSRPRSPFGRN